jgi:hypothetical protein
MGVKLEDRGIVQVSMNLTNYEKTPMSRVFEAVKTQAARHGVNILASEINGLVPAAALHATAEHFLQVSGFNANQVLENKLRQTTKQSLTPHLLHEANAHASIAGVRLIGLTGGLRNLRLPTWVKDSIEPLTARSVVGVGTEFEPITKPT